MSPSSIPLPALFASLRVALAADARAADARPHAVVDALILALVLRLLGRFEAMFLAWQKGTLAQSASHRAAAQVESGSDRLPFHLRAREARYAVIRARRSRGRVRLGIWWSRNRGARAIPSRASSPARTFVPRAPPVSACRAVSVAWRLCAGPSHPNRERQPATFMLRNQNNNQLAIIARPA